ncbi:MAG: hypothetical protein MJ171_03860 [Clostridia bacterium]|nr:hypothetical protein [Clostridia bacterium]
MTTRKTVFERLLSLVLSVAMIATSAIYPVSYAFAYDSQETSDSVLTVNGAPFTFNEETGKYEKEVHFGDNVTFGKGNGFSFSYVKVSDYSDDCDWNEFENGSPWLMGLPGSYYIGYTDSQSVESFDDSFMLTVSKSKIGKPETVKWSDGDTNIATYVRPVKTETGGEYLPNAVSSNIRIALYKDGNTTPVWSSETSVLQYSLRSTIEENGFGDYRFSVQFLSAQNEHYTDGDETFSNIYSYRDTNYPVIEEFTYDSENNTLAAKVSDSDTGVFAYAFSCKDDVKDVDFIDIENPAPGSISLSMEVKEGGAYNLYIRDGAGLITKSETPVYVTVLKYYGLYADGIPEGEKTEYFYGEADIEVALPARIGYLFTGYYDNGTDGTLISGESFTISKESPYFGKTVYLYAYWEKGNGTVKITAEGETAKEYDGLPVILTAEPEVKGVSLDDPEVSVNYVWRTIENGIISPENGNVLEVTDATSGALHYTCDVVISLPGNETITLSADPETGSIEIDIWKKEVSVSVKEMTVHFGESIPETLNISDFDFHDGLLEKDAEEITVGTVSTSYVKGSPCGVYRMIPEKFEGNNYSFTYLETENLNVIPSENMAGIELSLSYDETVFDGTEKTPEVTVTDTNLNRVLQKDEYTVEYSDNLFAGDHAKVTVTLKGDYNGTVEKEFRIAKAPVDIICMVHDYLYGESPESEVYSYMGTDGNPLSVAPEGGSLKIYARKEGSETWLNFNPETAKTLSAGKYEVKGEYSGDSNYLESVSLTNGNFTVGKRTVIFASGSNSWTYDGSAHSLPTVTETDTAIVDGISYESDGFAAGEGYKTIYSNTTVTEVTAEPVKNEIKYEFFSSVNPENYEIVLSEGTLEITGANLVAPGNVKWNPVKPGEVTFIAVSRPGLMVSYEISLYRADGEMVKASDASDCFQTLSTAFDLSCVIRKDSEENGTTGYYVQVKAVPVESTNYIASVNSRATALLYTANVSVSAGTGTENVTI